MWCNKFVVQHVCGVRVCGATRVWWPWQATAALDAVTEQAVMGSILRTVRDRGVSLLLITHRLSTVRTADVIHVMEGGRVVQQGSHEALAAREGPYARVLAAAHSTVPGGEGEGLDAA